MLLPTLLTTTSSSKYCNEELPYFEYENNLPFYIESYGILPENFCSDFIKTEFDCNLRDGFTFVSPKSAFLPDQPSDSINFDPFTTQTYYDLLIEGGSNPDSLYNRPNFAYPSSFLFTSKDITEYNGSYFVVSSFSDNIQPCEERYQAYDELFLKSYLFNSLNPYSKSTPDTTKFNKVPKQTIHETKFSSYGQLFYRNPDSSIIAPVSSALSGLFVKYSDDLRTEINNNLINFDLYYDTIQFETENYIIFDKIEFNYDTNLIKNTSTSEVFLRRGEYKRYEKFSTVWFLENSNELIFALTTLYFAASSSNFKIIYPKIFSYSLNDNKLKQIFPLFDLNEEQISNFSFLSIDPNTGLEAIALNVDITSIDKPVMSYSSEANTYNLTYISRDTSGSPYITTVYFKYTNGVLNNMRNVVFVPEMNINHTNFINLEYSSFIQQTILGDPGYVSQGRFIFN